MSRAEDAILRRWRATILLELEDGTWIGKRASGEVVWCLAGQRRTIEACATVLERDLLIRATWQR